MEENIYQMISAGIVGVEIIIQRKAQVWQRAVMLEVLESRGEK